MLEGVAARFEWHEKVVKLTTEFAAIRAEKTITNLALKEQSQICRHRNAQPEKANLPPCANSMLPPK